MSSFPSTIIQELAVHEWDIRSSLEPAAALSANSIPALMERMPSNRRPWTLPFPTTSPSSGPVRYRFQLTRPHGSDRDIVVEEGKARLETPGGGTAGLQLKGATDTFILLMYHRLTLDSAISAGRFTAEGDLGLVPDFDQWLAGH